MSFDYARRSREIEQHMIDDATARWAQKKGPADAPGATPAIQRDLAADGSGATRLSGRSNGEYNPEHHPSLIGSAETEFDRL